MYAKNIRPSAKRSYFFFFNNEKYWRELYKILIKIEKIFVQCENICKCYEESEMYQKYVP